jgi:hypothetical protein
MQPAVHMVCEIDQGLIDTYPLDELNWKPNPHGICGMMGMSLVVLFAVGASSAFGAVPLEILAMEIEEGSCVGPDPEPAELCRPSVKVDTDQFRYEICDPGGLCDCATVTVKIACEKGQGGGQGKGGKKK